MVLEISNLNFGYTKKHKIFQDFSLNLSRGEIIAIVGASGSGKSTLIELIIDKNRKYQGRITASKTAIIFQDPYSSFHPSFSILDQIKDVAEIEKIDIYLKKLNLDRNLLNARPHELSGGQLQRCSILRAILQKPELLLADEPTSALDNVTSLEVMRLLLEFLPNVGILLVTHDLDLANWCSDKIINLNEETK